MLYSNSYDLLFVTESWLHPDFTNGCLDPESLFQILRKNRTVGRGGGVCVFVHKGLNVLQVDTNDMYNKLEIVIFDLVCEPMKLRFFCVYRPPHGDCDGQDYLDLLIHCITSYSIQAIILISFWVM